MKKRMLGGYKPGKPGLEKVLGSLESDIMEVVWHKEREVSVRDVLDTLNTERELAYTTVMTIMNRLADKQLLDKRKEGNAFLFRPVLSRDEFTGHIIGSLIDDLLEDFSETTLSHFIKQVSKKDRAVLDQLEKALTEAKEQDDDR